MAARQIADLPPKGSENAEARGDLPTQVADFEPRSMVANFSPKQLLRTAVRTFFAHTIARYIDRRETQATLAADIDPWRLRTRSTLGRGGWALRRATEQMLRAGRPRPGAFARLIEADLSDYRIKGKEVWIDFIADLGDGWNPAYSMALLLAARKIQVTGLEEKKHDPQLVKGPLKLAPDELPRADVVILGGDQVYPTPSREGYTDRLVAPLACALPPVEPPSPGDEEEVDRAMPLLFAIPGNHDWYDGLTDFVRVFCQGGLIGRWRLRQTRSYFAIRLPHGWWLWGIDIQLDTRIDPVQLGRFRALADSIDSAGEPSNVILCTAKPSWLHGRTGLEDSYKNLLFFERQVMGEGAQGFMEATVVPPRRRLNIPVTLSGDMHHYSRYLEYERDRKPGRRRDGKDVDEDEGEDEGEDEDEVEVMPRQRITCGAGGAYLRGTHTLPNRVPRPKRVSQRIRRRDPGTPRKRFGTIPSEGELIEAGAPYPSRSDSRRIVFGALLLPLMKQNVGFWLWLGMIYAALVAALDLPEYSATPGPLQRGWANTPDYLRSLDPDWQTLRSFAAEMMRDHFLPWSIIVVAGMLAGAVIFALTFNEEVLTRVRLGLWGLLHGVAHVVLATLMGWGFAALLANTTNLAQGWYPAAVYALTLVLGGLAGGFLVGGYLVLSTCTMGWHENEAFSVQSIPDYRSFLRLRIDRDGNLTIYPIGVRRVPRQWRRKRPRGNGEPHFVPADAPFPQAHLIDGPIRIDRQP